MKSYDNPYDSERLLEHELLDAVDGRLRGRDHRGDGNRAD